MLVSLSKIFHLVIISSIDDDIINPYLKKNKIDYLFEEVWGIKRKTSKVEKFNDFLKLYRMDKKDCLFITDTLGDIKEANKVGIKSIGVSWGYQKRKVLEKGKPIMVVDSIKELESYLLSLNISRPMTKAHIQTAITNTPKIR